MTFIDVLLEGGPTFKTYLDKGREGLKSEDFRGDVSTIMLRLQRYRVREKTVLLNEADSPDVCRLFLFPLMFFRTYDENSTRIP